MKKGKSFMYLRFVCLLPFIQMLFVGCGEVGDVKNESSSALHEIQDRHYRMYIVRTSKKEENFIFTFVVCENESESRENPKCVFPFLDKDQKVVELDAKKIEKSLLYSGYLVSKRKEGKITEEDKTGIESLGTIVATLVLDGKYQPSMIIGMAARLFGEEIAFFPQNDVKDKGVDLKKMREGLLKPGKTDVYTGESVLAQEYTKLMKQKGKSENDFQYNVEFWVTNDEKTRFLFEDLVDKDKDTLHHLRIPLLLPFVAAMLYARQWLPPGSIAWQCLPHEKVDATRNGLCLSVSSHFTTGSLEKYQKIDEIYSVANDEQKSDPKK